MTKETKLIRRYFGNAIASLNHDTHLAHTHTQHTHKEKSRHREGEDISGGDHGVGVGESRRCKRQITTFFFFSSLHFFHFLLILSLELVLGLSPKRNPSASRMYCGCIVAQPYFIVLRWFRNFERSFANSKAHHEYLTTYYVRPHLFKSK